MPAISSELLRFDRDATTLLARATEEREALLQAAREEAIRLTQEAQRTRGKAREDAIREHDAKMHQTKDALITAARRRAEQLRSYAREHEEVTITHIITAFEREAGV